MMTTERRRLSFVRQGYKVSIIVVMLLSAVACGTRKAPASRAETKQQSEMGLASWYGKKFHGKRTASGERFDMYSLTAAHRTLPFGAVVRVTNLENGRSIRVRINDRGPFKKGRIIDVSYAAARKLEMVRRGVVRVRISHVRHG